MRATHRALREYGYAGLSIQRIADEAALSKSTFYHHYDSKEDLLASFVDYVLTGFMHVFSLESGDDPDENLRTFVELVACPASEIDRELPDDLEEIFRTYVELRALAARDESVRERFTATDETFNEQVVAIIEAGVEDGVFAPVDPERTASFLVTVVAGNSFLRATTDTHDMDAVRSELDAYIEDRLLA